MGEHIDIAAKNKILFSIGSFGLLLLFLFIWISIHFSVNYSFLIIGFFILTIILPLGWLFMETKNTNNKNKKTKNTKE